MSRRKFFAAIAGMAIGLGGCHTKTVEPQKGYPRFFTAKIVNHDARAGRFMLEGLREEMVAALPPLARCEEGRMWRFENLVCTVEYADYKLVCFSCSDEGLSCLCRCTVPELDVVVFEVLSCEEKIRGQRKSRDRG